MRKKDKISFFLMLLLLLLIVLSESHQKRINWYPSFAVSHKIPFGTYIAFHEAQKIFQDKLHQVKEAPYIFLNRHSGIKGTYVIYNDQVKIGKTGLKYFFDWVKKGNNLFLSSQNFEAELLDSLGLDPGFFINKSFDKRIGLQLDHPALKTKDSVFFDKRATGFTFKLQDSVEKKLSYLSLGHFVGAADSEAINFIDVKYGKGHFILHSFPYVFTNYFILKKHNSDYLKALFTYINLKQPVYWDVYSQNGASSNGIFKYMLETPAFLWAYRLLFIGLILYILFEGKRKQRAIPVVVPPVNETLNFTKTIAEMYLENKEHRLIGLMHINHFFNYVRQHLHLDVREKPEILKQKIAQKSKTDPEVVQRLLEMIDYIQQADKVSGDTILALEQQIELIKHKNKKHDISK